jgi:hypothetical protein
MKRAVTTVSAVHVASRRWRSFFRQANFYIMRTTIIFIALWLGICNASLAQNDIFDTFGWSDPVSVIATNKESNYVNAPESERILPEDIVQESIQLVRFTTNRFAIRWTYTEAGAKKMLAFREAHVGETVHTEVGNYEFIGGIAPFTSLPGCASYSEWRTGWLKHRTDKFSGVSEDDAKKIVAGLKTQ